MTIEAVAVARGRMLLGREVGDARRALNDREPRGA